MSERRVWRVFPGDDRAMRLERLDPSALGAGEVRVRHVAIGVNFIDVYHRTGFYPLPPGPHGLGVEAVGIVEELGSDVDDLRVGQRVGYISKTPGAYADERVVDAPSLIALPDKLDDVSAAASLLKGLTAEMLCRRVAPLSDGQTALVTAAAGGVGTILSAWLRHRGVHVVGLVGSEKKAARAWASGCERVIVLEKTDDFSVELRGLMPDGVDAVFDSVGKTTIDASLRCLKRRGTLVSYGNASGAPPPVDPQKLGQLGSLTLTRPSLFDFIVDKGERDRAAAAVFAALDQSVFKAHVGLTLPLEDAPGAHKALEKRHTMGATVLLA